MIKLSGPIDLIKQSFIIFLKKENLIHFLKIYLVLVPFSIFLVVEDFFIKSNPNGLNLPGLLQFFNNSGWLFGIGFLIGFIYLIISFWITVAGIKVIIGVVENNILSVKETFKFALQKLWKFSLLMILFGIMVGFGGILLIIPGLYLFITCYFSKFILIKEDVGVLTSLGRSQNLVKGKFWAVWGRMIVLGLFSFVSEIIFSLIPYGIGSVLITLFGALFVLPSYLLYRELLALAGESADNI